MITSLSHVPNFNFSRKINHYLLNSLLKRSEELHQNSVFRWLYLVLTAYNSHVEEKHTYTCASMLNSFVHLCNCLANRKRKLLSTSVQNCHFDKVIEYLFNLRRVLAEGYQLIAPWSEVDHTVQSEPWWETINKYDYRLCSYNVEEYLGFVSYLSQK